MPVEIAILSGTRQGERIELDTPTLRVGDSPSCDVYFNAEHDHAVKGRRLVLQRTDDGWQLKNEGRETVWVNHDPISSIGSIRSGDIVRLSELGPDFSFTILSGARQKLTADSDPQHARQQKPTTSPAATPSKPAAVPPRPAITLPSTATVSGRRPDDRRETRRATTTSQQAEASTQAPSNRKLAIAATAAVVLVLAAAVWLLRPPPEVRPPRLPEFGEKTIREGEVFTLSARVTDPGQPVGQLRYSLLNGEEYGIHIDPATGDIRWSTSEEHGPGNYKITVQALAASEDHEARDEKSFVLNVLEVNRPPHLAEVEKQTIRIQQEISLNIQLHVDDPDQPKNSLKLTLASGAPQGVLLDPKTGQLRWRPTVEQAGVHTLTVRVQDDGPQPLADETSFDVEVVKPDPWELAAEKVRRGTVLLVGEAPDTGEVFPFGTGLVFDRKAVITNGVLATELAKRTRDGWKVHVYHPAEQSKYVAKRILVHEAYELSRDQPADQIYFDVGIIEVAKQFNADDVARLALDTLERGQPLACLAIPHSGKPLTRFTRPQAESTRCEIYLITRLTPDSNDPGVPRLLHLSGKLPPNCYGGPIINVEGQVVGIYAESAASPADGEPPSIEDLHYAAIPSLAEAWRKGEGTKHWKPPAVEQPSATSETKENEQDRENRND